MSEVEVAILVAVIGGCFSLAGTIIANNKHAREMDHKLELHQAVTDTKLDELTREVREHNNFAKRVPVLEEQVKVANHRIEDLEKRCVSMMLRVKTSKIILAVMFGLLIAFVLKMIQLYETTGGVPDTLVQCVLGGGLAELALTAWITVSKVKKGE